MQKIRERSLIDYFLDLDFDLPPILALQMAYEFLAPPLRLFCHASIKYFGTKIFFLSMWHIHNSTMYFIKATKKLMFIIFLTLIKPTHIGIYDFDDHNVPLELVHC
jgi:hypothetical protein